MSVIIIYYITGSYWPEQYHLAWGSGFSLVGTWNRKDVMQLIGLKKWKDYGDGGCDDHEDHDDDDVDDD